MFNTARPVVRFSVMVFRKYVFILFRVEKLRSAVHVVTGIVAKSYNQFFVNVEIKSYIIIRLINTFKSRKMLGSKFSSHVCNDSSIVDGKSLLVANCDFHIRYSFSSWVLLQWISSAKSS